MKEIWLDSNRAYFEHLLVNVLRVYYPQYADNKLFIVERSEEAYDLYIELLNTEVNPSVDYELALKVLLEFS